MGEQKQSNDIVDQNQADADFGKHRSILVSAVHLASVLPFVSDNPQRYYLNGVFIEPVAEGGVVLVATNGTVLASAYDPDGRADAPWICPVPKLALSALRKVTLTTDAKLAAARYVAFCGRDMHVLNATFDIDADPTQIGATHKASVFAPPIDGTYPEWRRILPSDLKSRTAAPAVGFNPDFLDVFRAPVKAFMGKVSTAVSFQSGAQNEPVVVRIDNVADWLGLIMPMGVSNSGLQLPEWLGTSEVA